MNNGLLSVTPAFAKVWRRNAQVFLTLWKFNIFPSLAEPLLFIFVFGLGIGSYIDEMAGVPYIEFVAAGIIGISAIMQATFECTYGTYFRMKMQNTFEGIISTPISAQEVSLAEIAWGATRGMVNAILVLMVLLFMGVLHRWQVIFIPPLMFMAAFNFAAIGVFVTGRVSQMEYFHFYFAGFILPAQFLCGTFFPIERFPDAVQVVAWIIPLSSFIDISRSLMLGHYDVYLLPQSLWIIVSTLAFTELAVRGMYRRLVE
jgi:lipooligosaccharide transport system permease protein